MLNMKTNKMYKLIYLLVVTSILTASCKKDFLNRPPEDQLAFDSFDEVALTQYTNFLYGRPWFDFHDKTIYAIGDQAGGNLTGFGNDYLGFTDWSASGNSARLADGWKSLYSVIAHSNIIINQIPLKAKLVPAPAMAKAVAEARFFRALAYFYLVRIWGPVPIIESSDDAITSPNKRRIITDHVFRYIVDDLKKAESVLPLRSSYGSVSDRKRISKGAAQALLAKVYLYTKDYTNAKDYAQKVITSNEYGLLGLDYATNETFNTLFSLKASEGSAFDNKENIFSLQWSKMNSDFSNWGVQNTQQAYFALNGFITGSWDGWAAVRPTFNLIDAYTPQDLRRKATFMQLFDSYPDLHLDSSGVIKNPYVMYPTQPAATGYTRTAIKKYVVGGSATNGAQVGPMNTPMQSYILRYSDVLLIYTEAVMAGSGSTSDVTNYNKVRQRAGLAPKASVSIDELFDERRLEFAIECDRWFDLTRMDRTKATQILNTTNRAGYLNGYPDNTRGSQTFTISASQFTWQYPSGEISKNPDLMQAPVNFY
jgi:starch-binding outer membrane protein, SusD/RagB family